MTVRTHSEDMLLGRVHGDVLQPNTLGRAVEECWKRLPGHLPGIAVDAFAILPDHVHGIVMLGGAGQAPPLHTVVGAFKSCASRVAGTRLWQRGYHDRVIRDESELAALRHYVTYNSLNPRRPPHLRDP